MYNHKEYENDPRGYALDAMDDGLISSDALILACLNYMSHDDVRGMLDANELSPRFEDVTDLADELVENGLDDVAEILHSDGRATALAYIESVLSGDNWDTDPEGWRLGNLEVARDRLTE